MTKNVRGFSIIPILIIGAVVLIAAVLFVASQKGTDTEISGRSATSIPTAANNPALTPKSTPTIITTTPKTPTPSLPASYTTNFEISTTALVNPNEPPNSLKFSTNTNTQFTVTRKSSSTSLLQGDVINIYVMGGLGESVAIRDYLPEYTQITNPNVENTITRVLGEKDRLFFRNNLDSYSENHKYYYYTTVFETGESCNLGSKEAHCGNEEITYGDHHFAVYCVVENSEKVQTCDEFVRNLTLED